MAKPPYFHLKLRSDMFRIGSVSGGNQHREVGDLLLEVRGETLPGVQQRANHQIIQRFTGVSEKCRSASSRPTRDRGRHSENILVKN